MEYNIKESRLNLYEDISNWGVPVILNKDGVTSEIDIGFNAIILDNEIETIKISSRGGLIGPSFDHRWYPVNSPIPSKQGPLHACIMPLYDYLEPPYS